MPAESHLAMHNNVVMISNLLVPNTQLIQRNIYRPWNRAGSKLFWTANINKQCARR